MFNNCTFIKTNFNNYKQKNQDVFFKVNDLTLINFLDTTKHSIVSYNLIYWLGLNTPKESELENFKVYKSPTTGVIDLAFNSNPQPFKLNVLFNKILEHFTNTEAQGLRNRDLKQALRLVKTKPLDLIINGSTVTIDNVIHTTQVKLNSESTHEVTSNVVTFDLIKEGVVTQHNINVEFITQRKLKQSIIDYLTGL